MEHPALLMNKPLTAVFLIFWMSASAQRTSPLLTTLVSSSSGQPITIRVVNDSGIRDYANITLNWELKANGSVRQKGKLTTLPIPPKKPTLIRLPVRIAADAPEELYLDLHYYYHKRPAGEAHFLLHPWTGSQLPIKPTGELTFTDENGVFTIQSPAVQLRFDKQTGWLQSYTAGNNQLVEDTPGCKPRFWLDSLAPGYSSAGAAASPDWSAASQAPHLQLFSTSTGSQLVIVRTEYTLPETSCLLHLSYTVNAAGEMLVEQSLETDTARQGQRLPCFGMYWRLPSGFDSLSTYAQLPSSDQPACYRQGATGISTCDSVRWFSITRPDGAGLRITADSSLLTIHLQPSAPRIYVDTPVQPYQLPYANYRYAFKITPIAGSSLNH